MRKLLFTLAIPLVLTGVHLTANENVPSSRWYAGVHGGLTVPHEPGADSRGSVGARAGHRFRNRVDIGIYTLTSTGSDDDLTIKDTLVLLEANANLIKKYPGLHVGIKAGALNRSIQGLPGTNDISLVPFAFGIEAGYEIAWGSGVGLGLDVSHLLAGKREKTFGSGMSKTTVISDATSFTHLLLCLKYRF